MSEPSFYVWRRTLAAASPAVAPPPTVVPIRVTPSPVAPAIELALPSGAVVRFPAGVTPDVIAAVVRGVEERPC